MCDLVRGVLVAACGPLWGCAGGMAARNPEAECSGVPVASWWAVGVTSACGLVGCLGHVAPLGADLC